MTEPGEMLPPDPDPLAEVDGPPPADDGQGADADWHDAESDPPPDDGPDPEVHGTDPEFGGEA